MSRPLKVTAFIDAIQAEHMASLELGSTYFKCACCGEEGYTEATAIRRGGKLEYIGQVCRPCLDTYVWLTGEERL